MINVEKYQEKINKKYPNEKLIVLTYKGAKGYTEIKCGKCNKIYTYAAGEEALSKRKKVLCHNCQDLEKSKKRYAQRLKDIYLYDDLEILDFRRQRFPCTIGCKKCGEAVSFQSGEKALSRSKYFCKKCHPPKYDIRKRALQDFKTYLSTTD